MLANGNQNADQKRTPVVCEGMILPGRELIVSNPGVKFEAQAEFFHDMRQKKWKVERCSSAYGVFSPKLVSLFEKGKPVINGKDMEKFSRRYDNLLGQRHLEAMIREQGKIPAEWQEQDIKIVGLGMIWLDDLGNRCTPYIYCNKGPWLMDFLWIDQPFCAATYRLLADG